MQLFKFRNLFLSISFLTINLSYGFSDMNCFKANFDAIVSHKGKPFGLLEKILTIKKEGCHLKMSHEKWIYLKNSWMVDICRKPVHIKNVKGSVEVIKKEETCLKKNNNKFCKTLIKMKAMIQDDGLIFADGEKEDLNSDHGKVYCFYLLLKSHLEREIIFSKTKNYENILHKQERMTPSENIESSKAPRPIMDNIEPQEVSEENNEESSGTGSF